MPGAQVVAQATQCDKGAHAFCALEVVVTAPRYKTSAKLLRAEHRLVHASGWRGVTANTSDENASESPGSKYLVTYGTADGDLRAIELGWIHRSAAIERALARTLFQGVPAIDILLETGSR